MFRSLTAILFLILAAPAAAQSWCANGGLNPTEQVICTPPDLGWRDHLLEEAYGAVRHQPGVQPAQQSWLAGRNACGWNADCIRAAYDSRIAQLQGLAGGGGKPPGQPGGLQPAGPSWCSEGSLNPAERTICANPDLGQMDLYMADLYAQVRHYPGVQANQVAWLSSRNACQASYSCLYGAYAGRIAELRSRYGID
jgi:uncharacterized protein